MAQVPAVDSALSAQRKALKALLEVIEVLDSKLRPVSASDMTKDIANKPSTGGLETPEPMKISMRIRQNTDMTEYAQARIREIMNQLEI